MLQEPTNVSIVITHPAWQHILSRSGQTKIIGRRQIVANFDFSDGYVVLRLICGLFFIPHAIFKITNREASLFGLLETAGFKPVAVWGYTAMAWEWIVALCLITGFQTRYAASAGAIFLFVAAATAFKVSKKQWLWNLGGCEYPVFWGTCCVIVAMHG
jgi:putative oxidoreductase